MTKPEMSYWVRVLVPAAIFGWTEIALNHSSDPRIQPFITHYWFSYHGHWYSLFLLSNLFFVLVCAIFGRRHHRRQLREALAEIDSTAFNES